MKGQRVVVLGGAGFLGSHLCERLLGDGASVVCVDNFATGDARNVAGLYRLGRFQCIRHDLTEPLRMSGPVHCVLNLASPASPADCARRPVETLRAGALGTQHGLELARDKGAVFVQGSTAEVYGDAGAHPQREDSWGHVDPVGPRSMYEEGQRYAEALVTAYGRAHGVRVRIARIFNTYGPRMRLDDGRVVPTFVAQALRGEDFTVFGDGTQTRSFCYVSDVVEGLVRLALADVGEPVNLGNPEALSILEFAEAVRRVAGSGGRIVFQPRREADPAQRQPDITRARVLLGWEPRVPLEEGLSRTLAWFREALVTQEELLLPEETPWVVG